MIWISLGMRDAVQQEGGGGGESVHVGEYMEFLDDLE